MRIAIFLSRWTLIVLLSIVVMFPPIWAITSWAVEPITGKGLDLRGLGTLVAWAAMSFVVIWPISLWASYRLLRGIGQERRVAATQTVVNTDLVVIHEQVLDGKPVPFAEGEAPQGDNPGTPWQPETRAPAG